MPATPARPYRQVARAAATEETRRRIVAAFAAALERLWLDEITLDDVAAAAGTTRQTVIRLFGGKEGLLAAVSEHFGREVELRRALPRPATPAAIARAMADDYEASGETILRLLAQEGRHPALVPFLNYGRREHRDWVRRAFVDTLAACPPAEREALTDRLVVATDVYAWKLLRHDAGRSRTDTEAAIAAIIAAIVAAGSKHHG
ncbi:TetR/AcrR family transcriptional regulator [Roseomonas sp. JC162]|uniref:TetR/AcrR family transcriptional regulator n=1 Tax=Neoroseomonas marina TaxID=1232220 RepID=A0A848E941_9PROT|nr:TetR/AcrR family transcriptional regulator [Neoroseomonas marina]NMJ40974.1 TetR/AcrR family transcriptional regulator [Neoroseomonas marina]